MKDKVFENTLIALVGPTAVGKSDLAIRLASRYKCPIISGDSRQFFKELNIGTAKPSEKDLKNTQHYFINNKSILEHYSVGDFEKECIKLLDELFNSNKYVILVGGSGLYINAVCNGLDELPTSDSAIRDELQNIFKSKGIIPLQEELQEADPVYYDQVDKKNPQRLIRALEVYRITGKRFSDLRNDTKAKRNFKIIKIGLNIDRDSLYETINTRVDQMLKKGLLEEVKGVMDYRNKNALQTVGYKELFDFFDNKISLDEATELIKKNTRNYAKRQLTWFRKDPDISWFSPNEIKNIIDHIDTFH